MNTAISASGGDGERLAASRGETGRACLAAGQNSVAQQVVAPMMQNILHGPIQYYFESCKVEAY